MNRKFQKLLLIAALSVWTGCGSSSSDNKGSGTQGGQSANNPVQWESVPSKFNPEIETSSFKVDDIQKVEMNLFGFSDDVRISYSNQLAADEGQLKIYTVFYNSATFGSLDVKQKEKTVSLNRYGKYQCSIKITNGQIQDLDGGCFVRIEVILPAGAEIEVYNVDKLLTKRFIVIDNASFLKSLDSANWDKDRLEVIEAYLASYKEVNKLPSLAIAELKKGLEEFNFSEGKLAALEKLHSYVLTRDQLKAMIDSVFSVFDREKAYQICGI